MELAELSAAGESRKIRKGCLWEICGSLDRACLLYIQENEIEEFASEAEDRAFAQTYAQVHPISLSIQDMVDLPADFLELMDANKDVYLSELVRTGTIDGPGCVKTPTPKTERVRECSKTTLDVVEPPTRQLSRAFS